MHNLSHSPHTLSMLAAALLAVSLEAPLSAQWTNVSPAAGPAARFSHAMAYDSQRGITVVFGGETSGYAILSDTWEWSGSSWTQVATSGPAGRTDLAMAYDSQRSRTVLFGGWDGNNVLGDTWEWDGSSWTQVASTGPSARASHAMAYDSLRGVTVLFGGSGSGGWLGDTWEWDGSSWTLAATTGPSARAFHAMAYDSQRNVTVLFGGSGANGLQGDTWEWNGSSWTQVASTGPSPSARRWHAMSYDSLRGVTVLFGGRDNSGSYLGDTWEWNGSTWTQVATTGPSARSSHTMAYDSQRGGTVLFGGVDNITWLGDTWERRLVPAGVGLYGSGCGNPPLTFVPISVPALGSIATCVIAQVPAPYLGAVAVGFSNSSANGTPLPIELSQFGLPGCFQLTSQEANPLPVSAGLAPGVLQFQLAIPNDPSWVSLKLYLQSYCLAPGANALGAITSNGIEWTIGNY